MTLLAAVTLAISSPAVTALASAGGCVDVRGWHNSFTFTGRLVQRRFPSPSVSASPEGERALILELDEPICAYDGGEFANPNLRFDRIHVWGPEYIARELTAAVGRRVELSGEAFPAHTGHHHAPLLLDVRRVVIR